MRMRMGKVWDEWDIEIGTLVGVSENVRMILSLNGMRMRKVWDEIKIGGSWNIYIKFRFNIMRMRIVWELWEWEKYEMSEILRLEPWWESPTTTHPSPLPPVEWADSPDPGWKTFIIMFSWSSSSSTSWSMIDHDQPPSPPSPPSPPHHHEEPVCAWAASIIASCSANFSLKAISASWQKLFNFLLK